MDGATTFWFVLLLAVVWCASLQLAKTLIWR